MPYPIAPYSPSERFTNNPRLVDLIVRQGQDRANALRQQGQDSAQMWSNVGQGIQNTVGNVVNAVQKQKEDQQTAQIRAQTIQANAQQIEAGARAAGDTRALDEAYASSENRDAILAKVPGHLRATVSKAFTEADDAAARSQKLKSDAAEADADYFGALAYGVKPFLGDPAQAMNAVHIALSQAKANGHADADQWWDQIKQNPDSLPSVVDSLIKKSPKFVKIAADEAKDAASQKSTDAQRDETARHNREIEAISKLTQGREAAQAAEVARHNRAIEQAANPFGTVGAPSQQGGAGGSASPAPATGPTGDDFLKSLSPNIASEVKAYAEGRRPFPAGFALKSPYFQQLIQLVGQYDPTFDAANYNARAKARTDLTSPSGTGGKTINALNTAIQHAGKLSDLIETLDNFESPLANAIVNPIKTQLGSTKVTNYNAVAPQLAKEIERAWRGTGGSAGEIKALIDTIGSSKGKQQQREVLQQFIELAKGKLDATQQQRDNVMGGAGASIPVLFDQSKAIMDKIDQRASGDAATPSAPAAGRIRVKGPNGPDGKPQTGTIPAGSALPVGWSKVP